MNALARALFILLILIGAVRDAACGLPRQCLKGKRLFEEHCMVCHGQGGRGWLSSVQSTTGRPDLPAVQEKLDAALLRTIHEGDGIRRWEGGSTSFR